MHNEELFFPHHAGIFPDCITFCEGATSLSDYDIWYLGPWSIYRSRLVRGGISIVGKVMSVDHTFSIIVHWSCIFFSLSDYVHIPTLVFIIELISFNYSSDGLISLLEIWCVNITLDWYLVILCCNQQLLDSHISSWFGWSRLFCTSAVLYDAISVRLGWWCNIAGQWDLSPIAVTLVVSTGNTWPQVI